MAWSAPAVIVALVVAYKLISAVLVGNSAASALADRDVEALRGDLDTLEFLRAIEPDKAAVWSANVAAVEGNLVEADAGFSELLSHTGFAESCAVRINLELVRETHGDVAARDGSIDVAERRYRDALAVVEDAPQACFEGNADPDPERRAIRNDAAVRLIDKINALRTPSQPVPPAPAPGAPPPPPPPPPVDASAALGSVDPDWPPGEGPPPTLRLEPGVGNPLDHLQEALGNSDASAQASR